MQTDTVSLHAFCKDNDLSKTSVRRWLIEQGFSTSDGLSPDAIASATAQFCPAPAPTEPAAPAGMTIHTGNHCTTIDVPGFAGTTVDLGQFRDSNALVIDDPLAVAEQFLKTADLIQDALAGDIAAREQRLARTRQAQQAVANRAQQLALEQRLYRLQTGQLDQAQTGETTALADSLAALQSLGKPAADEPAAPGA
jgi:hypothetical protein